MIKYTDPPQSRNEEILKATINGTSYDKEPQSRIEDLLIELKAAIEGGGGGGTTNYNSLENRPQINSHTLEGNMSFADLGIDETPTEDSTNAVASGGVYAGLADKIDKSSTGYETITGNPIEFDSPSPQMVNMKCDIVPSQDLHGYDKPWAGGEGKNKLPLVLSDIKALNTSGTWSGNVYTFNNVTFEVIADDNEYVTEIRANGTAAHNIVYFQLAQNISVDSPLIFSTGYTDNWNTNGHVMELRVDSTTYSPYDVSGVEIPAGTYDLLGIAVAEGATVNNNYKPMLRLTAVSDYSFAPYSNICPISGVDTIDIDVTGGETYTIDLDGTRYGGTLDVTSGVLTLTHGSTTYSGSDVDLYSDNYENLRYARVPKVAGSLDMDMYTTNCISSMFRCGDIPPGDFDNPEHIGLLCGDTEGNKYWIGLQKGITLQEAQNLIDGLQVVYELATPQTIQLTPTQVWAVQGGNTITVSVDGVEAEIHSSAYATLRDINDLWDYIKQSPQGSSDGVRFGASNLEMIGGTML